MSSIYRKGRDGYFYYQTYVRNPVTGNKDKRIFHSLQTKNREEAKRKQISLDMKYEKINEKKISHIKEWLITNSKILILIISTSIITLYIDRLLRPKNNIKKNHHDEINIYQADHEPIKEDTASKKITDSIIVKPKRTIAEFPVKEKIKKVVIPQYNVERLERLSDNFEQGKIYLTVDKNTDSESLHLLCEKIMRDHSEFSNFVICLYSSDHIGRELANGNYETFSVEERKESWLAMYTYNVVEGEYFDDNPSGYLGSN